MKQKIKKILLFMLAIMSVSNIKSVSANTYNDRFNFNTKIDGDYVTKIKPNYKYIDRISLIRRVSDNAFVYCIQPATETLLTSYTGYDTDQEIVANMTKEQFHRISLLSYYGYGYGNHTDIHWYSATQMLIWQTVNNGFDIYFTNGLDGPRITKYQDYMNELNELVNNHYKLPNFNKENIEMTIGETITLNDSNGVLSNYSVTGVNGVRANINGNSINITAEKIGSASITLTKKDTRFNVPPIVYVRSDSQNVMSLGSYDPLATSIKINIIGGKVTLNKYDVDTNKQNPQGEATLGGAKYGIYKADGTFIENVITDSKGNITSNYLPSLGTFYLKEISPSNGYQLDDTLYYFEIKKDNLYPIVKVYEKVIERKFNFMKVYADEKTSIMKGEPNVKFGIYDKNNKLVKEIITDKNGNAKITLPYGHYTVKQLTSTKDYEKVKDFNIEVSEVGDDINLVISNAQIKARLKVIKIDADSKKIIKRSKIKFKIFNITKNEYVCQKVTYPNKKTICEYQTNEDGEFLTPYLLESGKYRLEEVDQKIDGYLWNKESIDFEIGEDSKLITDPEYGIIFEVKFANKPVYGSVEITKNGESVELTKDGYVYTEIKLEGVKIGLFANENIYDASGNLIYKKGTKISELITDENGYIKFNNLYLGKYYIQELETTNGHVLDNKKYEFELKYKDQYTPIVNYSTTLKNHLPKGTLEFTKTDFSESNTLPNTLIEIYNEDDELVFSGRTDENGKIIIEKLLKGKYYIVEKEAPEGYKLNEEKMYFEITEDGQVVKAIMKDEVVEVPSTGLSNIDWELVSGVILGLSGLGLVIYGFKKGKK